MAAHPAHRERLRDLHSRGVLQAAGPWDDDSDALLILDTDAADTEAAIAADRHFATPGAQVVADRADSRPNLRPRLPPAPRAAPAGRA